ncbi:MAG: TIGR02186 family protein [Neomegalonema sp.]|nr:TIGR02186 family protein [Neomegalonema sp.]
MRAAVGIAAIAALVIGVATAWATSGPLDEEPVVAAAQKEVAITATFAGDELFVYGAVSRSRRLQKSDGPLDVVIVVEGPAAPIIVRKKKWIAGLWINAAAFFIAEAPSYYAVASTRPLLDILDKDGYRRVSLDGAVIMAGTPFSAEEPLEFRQAAIRLRRRAGFYVTKPSGVALAKSTLYQARFSLPANIIEGAYAVTVYLVRNKRIVGEQDFVIPVRRKGLEQFLYRAAMERPTLYGLGTLATALIAGYLASEIFRRLRRG